MILKILYRLIFILRCFLRKWFFFSYFPPDIVKLNLHCVSAYMFVWVRVSVFECELFYKIHLEIGWLLKYREKRDSLLRGLPPLLLSPDFYFRANIHWVCMCVWERECVCVCVFMSRCVWVVLQSDVLKSIWPCLKMSCLCNLSCAITWMKKEGPLRTYFSRYSTFGTYIKNQLGDARV